MKMMLLDTDFETYGNLRHRTKNNEITRSSFVPFFTLFHLYMVTHISWWSRCIADKINFISCPFVPLHIFLAPFCFKLHNTYILDPFSQFICARRERYPEIYLICRDSFHRLSIRSRTLVRSNTMNKEDLEKVKEMNLAKKANTSTSPLAKESRTPQMFRSNTTLDGSIRPLNIRKSSIIARSKVVCRWY